MGLYATVRGTVTCPDCHELTEGEWQFHFGSVWDLPAYQIGDTIRWGGPQTYGSPAMELVHAVAYTANERACSRCGSEFLAEIRIENGRLAGMSYLTHEPWIEELVYEGADRIPRSRNELFRKRH